VSHYPLLVNLEGKRVTVVGGGAVAERKVRSVLECGAHVTVVAPELAPGLRELAAVGSISHRARHYRLGDLDGATLAFVAVDDAEVSATAAKEAEAAGVLVNVADGPELCDFIVPSIMRRGRLTIAISTGGASPAWARRIRTSLEGEFGEEYARLLEATAGVRRRCLEEMADPTRRREALSALADDSLLDPARSGTVQEIEKKMEGRAGLGSETA
jgi:precorrin-2 dehydrogenase/sirohydrochlorin ferrochelatase